MDDNDKLNKLTYARELLGKARRLLVEARQDELAPYHISPLQLSFLRAIRDLGQQATLVELSKYFNRAVNTVSLQITALEKLGMISKILVIPKSRQLRFELTELGRTVYDSANDSESLRVILGKLSDEELRQMAVIMEKLISAAETYQREHRIKRK
jgi:DNA-binding MarR family transcriptional regulator